MTNYINPTPPPKPSTQEEPEPTENPKPTTPPPTNDRFQKLLKRGPAEQPSKEETEQMGELDDTPPSLFDLSRSKVKSKLTSKKDQTESPFSPPGLQSKPPLGAKKELKEESEGSEEMTEDSSLMSPKPMTDPASNKGEKPNITQGKKPEDGQSPDPLAQQKTIRDQVIANQSNLQEASSARTQKSNEPGTSETSKKDKTKGSSKSSSEGASEKTATGFGVQPGIQSVGLGSEKTQENPTEMSSSQTIADLVNQLVESVQTLKKADSMDTLLTLKHPPLLAGATITITAFTTAKGEFNLAFGNLSPQAKIFLDQKLSQNSLSDAMSQKGIVIHIVTTSTENTNPMRDQGQPSQQDSGQENEQQKKKQQQETPEDEQ